MSGIRNVILDLGNVILELDVEATILAFEKNGVTTVYFYDGKSSRSFIDRETIGDSFVELTAQITAEVNRMIETRKEKETGQGQRKGKILPQGKPRGKSILLQPYSTGRPSDPNYDEAHHRLKRGEAEEEVFNWYCEAEGITNPGKSERDAFRKAMRRRK